MDRFTVQFTFLFGRCSLEIRLNDQAVRYSTYHLHRSFESLLGSVSRLIDGTENCTSSRWVEGEVGGGVYLDLVRDPGDGVNIAIHEFQSTNQSTEYHDLWGARRGDLLWSARIPLTQFAIGFAQAIREVEVRYVDRTGYMEQWGWKFPHTAADQIAATAQSMGHQPAPTSSFDS